MPAISDTPALDDFIATYEELSARFDYHDNARALLNDVAAEVLAAVRRPDGPGSCRQPRRYFLWLLARKGFNAKCFLWRDVDLPRHQCGYKAVTNLALEEFNVAGDSRFAFDPRPAITNGILFAQALDALEPGEQRLLVSRLVEGRTLREIAESVHLTPQGVKKRLDKIYARIRHALADGASPSGDAVPRSKPLQASELVA